MNARFRTTFDAVGQNDFYYFIRFQLITPYTAIGKEIDYLRGEQGQLLMKSHAPCEKVAFDINDKGELIVISEDADRYFINEDGELCYYLDM